MIKPNTQPPSSGEPIAEAAQDTLETAPPREPVKRPDPVRYGDWEIGGRCIDF